MSAQPCGCDPEANWVCEAHQRTTTDTVPAPDNTNTMTGFVIKDSGKRHLFSSGMTRDVTADKIDYLLALDGPMFRRCAEHLTKGAKKYTKRNWMQANSTAELERFRESALRHFLQWLNDEVDEDHAAAVFFNINGAEYVKERLKP